MTESGYQSVSRRRHVTCPECEEFEMEKSFSGAPAPDGLEEYEDIGLPDTCPVCGADLVITMADGGQVGDTDHDWTIQGTAHICGLGQLPDKIIDMHTTEQYAVFADGEDLLLTPVDEVEP